MTLIVHYMYSSRAHSFVCRVRAFHAPRNCTLSLERPLSLGVVVSCGSGKRLRREVELVRQPKRKTGVARPLCHIIRSAIVIHGTELPCFLHYARGFCSVCTCAESSRRISQPLTRECCRVSEGCLCARRVSLVRRRCRYHVGASRPVARLT